MKTLFLLNLISLGLLAQTPTDPRGDQIILSVSNKPTSVFTVYPANTIAKGDLQNISQAKNSTPEKVFEAILSETSFEWTKHNSIGGELKPKKDEYYAKMKSMDKAANFYLLRCKWGFEAAGSQYAIVKFDFQNQEGKKATGAYTLVKKDGRWFRYEKAYTTNVCLLFIAFKDEVLKTLFEGKTTDNLVYNALLKEVIPPME